VSSPGCRQRARESARDGRMRGWWLSKIALRKDEEMRKKASTWAGTKAHWNVKEKLGNARRDSEEPFQKVRFEPNLAVVCEGFWRFNVAVHNVKHRAHLLQIRQSSSKRQI
jgi:hypothetical protein